MKWRLLIGAALLGLLISPVWGVEQPAPDGRYETVTLDNGKEVARYRVGVTLPLPGDYDWWYGCAPTSAGMMMGHYDVNGYQSTSYSNLMPAGVAENETFIGPPTGSSAVANQAIASAGHITDFYGGGYGAIGDDVPSGRSPDCLADFMGTSQDLYPYLPHNINFNGSTSMYHYPDGSPLYVRDAYSWGPGTPGTPSSPGTPGYDSSGMYGMFEYLQYAGYFTTENPATSTKLYNQYIQGYSATNPTNGFTWAQYKAEIDAGRPVMLHIVDPPLGHAMAGVGYQEPPTGGQIVELCDTWSIGHGTGTPHTMNWGGVYGGMTHYAVTVMDFGATAQGILVTGFAGNWDYQDGYNPPDTLILTKWATDMGPFDLEITVTGGIDPINILEEVFNQVVPPVAWTDYHVQLGTGLGPAFQPSITGDGLSFLSGSSFVFPLTTFVSEDELSFAGGLVPPGFWADFDLWVKLPPGASDPFIFTLRQWPTTATVIPEPSALVLLVVGAVVLAAFGSRRRRR